MTGTIERPELGLSFDYTATRRNPNGGASSAGSNQSLAQFIDDFNKRSGSNNSVSAGVLRVGPRPNTQPAATPTNNALPQHLNDTFEEAKAYYTKGPSPAVVAAARQILPDFAHLSDAQVRERLVPSLTRQGMQSGEWIDSKSRVGIPGDARPISLQEGWNTSETAFVGNDGIDPQIEARALKLFPLASQANERTQYIINEMNTAADRQQGNSYSIHVTK
jgi:hypothetical protein